MYSNKNKSKNVSAMMKNKALTNALHDALNSPVGSTKRAKAKIMIKSMQRFHDSQDGQGGYIDPEQSFIGGIVPRFGMGVGRGLEAVGRGFGAVGEAAYKGTAAVGKGAAAGLIGAGAGIPEYLGTNIKAGLVGGQTISPSETSGGRAIASMYPGRSTTFLKAPLVSKEAGVSYLKDGPKTEGVSYLKDRPTPKLTPDQKGQAVESFISQYNRVPVTDQDWQIATDLVGSSVSNLSDAPASSSVSYLSDSPPASYNPVSTVGDGSYDSGMSDGFNQMFGSLDTADQDKWKGLWGAINSGEGFETFFTEMMLDRNELRKLPGFENLPDDFLPEGVTLTRQLANLKDALKTEWDVDAKLDALNAAKGRGYNLGIDLEDYVTSRDEYLSKIDDMMLKSQDAMMKMDMANPYVQKSMQRYNDYLTVLKGRHQKRYADYVNQSINQHNTDLQRLADDYNNTYTKFADEYNTDAAMTQEDYNHSKAMIKELWDYAAGYETRLAEKEAAEIDRGNNMAIYVKNFKDAFDYNPVTGEEVENKVNKMTDTDRARIREIITGYNGEERIGEPYTNIYEAKAIMEREGLNSSVLNYNLKNYFKNEIGGILGDNTDTGKVNSIINSARKYIYDSISVLQDPTKSYLFDPQEMNELKNSFISSIVSRYSSILNGENKSELVEALRDAIKQISKEKWIGKDAKHGTTEVDKKKFVNGYDGKLPKSIVSTLYDTYIENGANGLKNLLTYNDNQIIQAFVGGIPDALDNKYFNDPIIINDELVNWNSSYNSYNPEDWQ